MGETDMEVRAWMVALLLAGVAGCQSPQLLVAPPAPVSATPMVEYQVLEPTPAQVHVRLDQIGRGPRGGVLRLTLRNENAESDLLLDFSKAGIRLGNGQHRKCIDSQRFAQLCQEFGAAAYGHTDDAGEWPLISPGTIYRLKPGEEIALAIAFGAPELESSIVLALDAQALYFEGQGDTPQALRLRIQLPDVSRWKNPPWWPDWLHVGVVATNG
jgi:hypothetical protein